jgi:hypothetical protein
VIISVGKVYSKLKLSIFSKSLINKLPIFLRIIKFINKNIIIFFFIESVSIFKKKLLYVYTPI